YPKFFVSSKTGSSPLSSSPGFRFLDDLGYQGDRLIYGEINRQRGAQPIREHNEASDVVGEKEPLNIPQHIRRKRTLMLGDEGPIELHRSEALVAGNTVAPISPRHFL